MSKKGLGRGLQALIPDDEHTGNSIKEILLSKIEPNPEQPRKDFDEESLKELADSLLTHGLLQPILVRPDGDKYYIIAGERRFRAAQIAGFEKVACIIQDCSVEEMAEKAIVENIQRSNLSPFEEGLAYARLINEYGLTQEQVAKRVGKGRPTIANLLRIINLPEPVLTLLNQNKISLGHAKLLVGLNDTSMQVLVAQKAAKEDLSVRDTEKLLERLKGEKENKTNQAKKRAGNPLYSNIEEKLSSSFQTKVKLKGDHQKGRIEIDYYSKDELDRLLELWKVEIE